MHAIVDELDLLRSAGYPIVYLLTHEEERALRLVAAGLRKNGVAHKIWSLSGGSKGADAMSESIRLLGSLKSAGAGVSILLDFHTQLHDPQVVRKLRDLVPHLSRVGHLLLIVSPVPLLPVELEKDMRLLELPLPTALELRQIFSQLCVEKQVLFDEPFVDSVIRAARGLTEQEARRVFVKALVKGGGFKLDDLSVIIEEKKKSIRKSEVLEFYQLDETLHHVGGLSEVKRWLASRSRAFGDKAAQFGLPAPKGLLLIGVQGCGKSLCAKAVAGSWHLPLIRLDLASVFGASSPEGALRNALRVIESLAPVVLWVDEIEKGFAGAASGQAGAPRVFGSFVTWLQEKKAPVFVVATANEVHQLPPELLRKGRFDETFFIDLPDVHERQAILAIHLKTRRRNPEDFELDSLAEQTEHYSGAELEQGVVAGLYRAFDKGRELEQADLSHELDQIVPLYATYEEKIKGLRDWAKNRTRRATVDQSLVDLFDQQ